MNLKYILLFIIAIIGGSFVSSRTGGPDEAHILLWHPTGVDIANHYKLLLASGYMGDTAVCSSVNKLLADEQTTVPYTTEVYTP